MSVFTNKTLDMFDTYIYTLTHRAYNDNFRIKNRKKSRCKLELTRYLFCVSICERNCGVKCTERELTSIARDAANSLTLIPPKYRYCLVGDGVLRLCTRYQHPVRSLTLVQVKVLSLTPGLLTATVAFWDLHTKCC